MGWLYTWVRKRYEKNQHEWKRSDEIIWFGWDKLFIPIVVLGFVFWSLKVLLIDIMLVKYGFERMVAYVAIIVVLRPTVIDITKSIMEVQKKYTHPTSSFETEQNAQNHKGIAQGQASALLPQHK